MGDMVRICVLTQNYRLRRSNTVRKVPLLIRLTSVNGSRVFDSAQVNGQDIRFSGTDGKHLPYQIERWNKPEIGRTLGSGR